MYKIKPIADNGSEGAQNYSLYHYLRAQSRYEIDNLEYNIRNVTSHMETNKQFLPSSEARFLFENAHIKRRWHLRAQFCAKCEV